MASPVLVICESTRKLNLDFPTNCYPWRKESSGLGTVSHILAKFWVLVIAISFLSASTYLVATGHDLAGGLLGTVDIVALVTVFVVGSRRYSTGRELAERGRY